jgi:hypothetical protein
MGIISWIILGLIAGFIGSKIVDRQGHASGSTLRSELSALLSVDFYLTSLGHPVLRPEHLQHDRRHRWIDRCAADLQRADRAPPRLMHRSKLTTAGPRAQDWRIVDRA